jgi:colicin import membrane protein
MKKLAVLLVLVGLSCLVWSQPLGFEQAIAKERDRLKRLEAQEDSRYKQESSACYQRFAVTDCLNEVRGRRRQTMEDLRRQEIALNEMERKQQGADQLKRTEEKSSEQNQLDEANRRAQAAEEHRERIERSEQKKIDRANADLERAGQTPRVKNTLPGPYTDASKASEMEAFTKKQQQALDAKARRDKALAERDASKVLPLPARP